MCMNSSWVFVRRGCSWCKLWYIIILHINYDMCVCCIVNDIMLQAQYVFVHDALCEVIQCGDTEILASRLSSTVGNMAQNISGQTISGFQEQFQVSTLCFSNIVFKIFGNCRYSYWIKCVANQWKRISSVPANMPLRTVILTAYHVCFYTHIESV